MYAENFIHNQLSKYKLLSISFGEDPSDYTKWKYSFLDTATKADKDAVLVAASKLPYAEIEEILSDIVTAQSSISPRTILEAVGGDQSVNPNTDMTSKEYVESTVEYINELREELSKYNEGN